MVYHPSGTLAEPFLTINDFWYTKIEYPFSAISAMSLRMIDRNREPAAGKTLPEQIADRLRRDILLEKLRPGASVKERDTAAEMGVSRTPLREAIRMLAQEGLIQLRPSRSPVVASPSLKEVTDDLVVMRALEVLSGELACRNATAEDISEVAAIHQKMIDCFGYVDTLDLFEIDMAFHQAVARASRNRSLAQTHGAYLARLWRARYLSARQRANRERVLRQHGAILTALQERDPDRIIKAIGVHLRHQIINIADLFEAPEGEPPDVPEFRPRSRAEL